MAADQEQLRLRALDLANEQGYIADNNKSMAADEAILRLVGRPGS